MKKAAGIAGVVDLIGGGLLGRSKPNDSNLNRRLSPTLRAFMETAREVLNRTKGDDP